MVYFESISEIYIASFCHTTSLQFRLEYENHTTVTFVIHYQDSILKKIDFLFIDNGKTNFSIKKKRKSI